MAEGGGSGRGRLCRTPHGRPRMAPPPVARAGAASSTGLSEPGSPLLFLLPPPRPTGTSTPTSPVVQGSRVFIRWRGGWTAGEAGQDGSGLGAGVKLSGPRWLQVWWVGCQAEGWGLPASALLQGSSEEASTSGHSRRASQRVPGRLRDVGSFWSEKKRPSVKGRRFFLVVTLA